MAGEPTDQAAGPGRDSASTRVPAVHRDAPEPLHLQISGQLRELILSRAWLPHHRVLPELALAQQLGVARGTLRKAVKVLTEEGLLVQVQGRGTFVTSRGLTDPVEHDTLSLAEAMSSHGIAGATEVLSRTHLRATAQMAQLLALDADSPTGLTRLERLRTAEGTPVAFFVDYVRTDLCPDLDDRRLAAESLYALIERSVGRRITGGRRTYAARAADRDLAERLEVEVGAPLQYFEQVTYLEDGRAVELAEVWIRSDLVRLTSMVTRAPDQAPPP